MTFLVRRHLVGAGPATKPRALIVSSLSAYLATASRATRILHRCITEAPYWSPAALESWDVTFTRLLAVATFHLITTIALYCPTEFQMSDDAGGKYVCTGGFIVSGMIVGSVYGGTAGAAAGGAPAVPGVVIGALGGALWAAVLCTRPAVKRLFQIPLDKLNGDFDKAIDVSSLESELDSFAEDSASKLNVQPEVAVAFMLEYLQRNKNDVFSLASRNDVTSLSMLSAQAKRGIETLGSARPLT